MAKQRTAVTPSMFSVTVLCAIEQALGPIKQRSLEEIISNRATLAHRSCCSYARRSPQQLSPHDACVGSGPELQPLPRPALSEQTF